GSRVFAGASIEAGKISEPFQAVNEARTRTSLGIYLGADTALGPLYFGYGRARDRGSIFYFFLGQP
ncbi:MAG: esterase, partial [Burkholderiales bacterium]